VTRYIFPFPFFFSLLFSLPLSPHTCLFNKCIKYTKVMKAFLLSPFSFLQWWSFTSSFPQSFVFHKREKLNESLFAEALTISSFNCFVFSLPPPFFPHPFFPSIILKSQLNHKNLRGENARLLQRYILNIFSLPPPFPHFAFV